MQDNLMYLLRLGMDVTDVRSLSISEAEWQKLFCLAKEQAVLGVCLRAMEVLPEECRPPKPILLQWIAAAEKVRRQNTKVNAVLSELVKELHDNGIEPIVVKGQVVAQEYSTPELRTPGDIDAFFDSLQWGLVESWVQSNGFKYKRSAAEKHIELTYKGVQVELHYHLNAFSTKKVQDYWERQIEDKALSNSRLVNIDGCAVRTLGVTESLLHLMVHIHHHILTEGVGVRQLMDMTLFLNNHFDEIDFKLLKQHLHGIGHHKAFAAYCALMNKYLGLPKEKIPYELTQKDYAYADKIMAEVWRGGNFGHKNNLHGVPPGLLHSLNTARLVLSHAIKFYSLAPSEARTYWWHKIFWRMKRQT